MEVALLAPWLFLMCIGVLDFGFYAYAAISTQHAARVAALYTSSASANAADSGTACYYALQAMKDLPNMQGVTACGASLSQVTALQPLAVQAVSVPSGIDGAPASKVSVTYQTIPLFPIPGLMGQMTITRTAQMRVGS